MSNSIVAINLVTINNWCHGRRATIEFSSWRQHWCKSCNISLLHATSSGCVDLSTGNVVWGRQEPSKEDPFTGAILVPPPMYWAGIVRSARMCFDRLSGYHRDQLLEKKNITGTIFEDDLSVDGRQIELVEGEEKNSWIEGGKNRQWTHISLLLLMLKQTANTQIKFLSKASNPMSLYFRHGVVGILHILFFPWVI